MNLGDVSEATSLGIGHRRAIVEDEPRIRCLPADRS